MRAIEHIHENYVLGSRAHRLAHLLAELIPHGADVLDVGCGDGSIAQLIARSRPDVAIRGVDVLVRDVPHIPIEAFDGRELPFEDSSFDVVMFVDVLHHTNDPMVLLRQACRVARRAILIKDHNLNGVLAGPTLRFMDRVGNSRFGVELPFNYWPRSRWREAFVQLDLKLTASREGLGLYPWPASWIFGRALHFIAKLDVQVPRRPGRIAT